MKKNWKKIVSTAVVGGVMVIGLTVIATPTFTDVPAKHWAYNVIDEAFQDGAIGGMTYNKQTGERTFEPDENITDAQFFNIIARAFYADEMKTSTTDYHWWIEGQWWANAAIVCEKHGLMYDREGERDLNYYATEGVYLGDNLRRVNMASIMMRVVEDFDIEKPSTTEVIAAARNIPDYDQIHPKYQEDVATAVAMGLIGGIDNKGTFAGDQSMTRAQAAAIYCRLKNVIENDGVSVPEIKPDTTPEVIIPSIPVTPEIEDPTTKPDSDYVEGKLANGKPITEANIQEVLEELKEEYPHQSAWGMDKTYEAPHFGWTGVACSAFGAMISDEIFGVDAPVYKHKNFDDLKVGDYLSIRNSKTGYNHAVIITELYSEEQAKEWGAQSGIAYENVSGNVNGKVNWESGINYSESLTKECTVYSRYK